MKLGAVSEEFSLQSADEFADVLPDMVGQSQLSIKILTHQLDEKIFDNAPFLQALARIAVKSRYSKVMILIRDPLPALKSGHGIIDISQRFSTGIEVRRVSRDHRNRADEYLIADHKGLVLRTNHDRYQGIANYFDRNRLPELMADFKDQWEFATPEMQFRRLHL